MASILIVSGANDGDYYPFGKRTMVIGRDEGCVVQITDSKASRRHAQIRWDETKKNYVVLDMKSTNGTIINGHPLLNEIPLVDGDEVTIGETKIVFCDTEFPDKQSALTHWKKRGERAISTIQQHR